MRTPYSLFSPTDKTRNKPYWWCSIEPHELALSDKGTSGVFVSSPDIYSKVRKYVYSYFARVGGAVSFKTFESFDKETGDKIIFVFATVTRNARK